MRALKQRAIWTYLGGLALALLLPLFVNTGYARAVLVLTSMFIIFALSYDLSVGHVGTVHLAPPAFFGLGAYVTAILGPTLHLNFAGSLLLSSAAMALLALLIGVPFFRLSDVTFAIGTLAFALVSRIVVNNAVSITGGPLCIKDVPRPTFLLPGGSAYLVSSAQQYYYLLLPLLFFTILVYHLLTTARIGRSFVAVREDEVLASSIGINPLRYKMLAFVVGAAIAGGLGSFQAQYITVVCPTELALDFTLRLLIIIFVGGAGTLLGIVLGSIIFTVLPELMRSLGQYQISPAHQLMIFAVILLLVISYSPDGLKGLVDRIHRRAGRGRRLATRASKET
jgi:ABC-type branched-subunit amino acid transport system permease subunit